MSQSIDVGGATVFVEGSSDVPLVWLRVSALGGSVCDPAGREGQARHGALLARRGAGARSRTDLDQHLDAIGASIDVSTSRDAVTLSALCLSRHIDTVLDTVADILAAPRMDPGEHDKLLRESRSALDDLRDDDSEIADRFFARFVAPGTPYARTSIGTETTLASLTLDDVRGARLARVVPRNLVIGLAGDVAVDTAARAAGRLIEGLTDADPPPRVALPAPEVAGRPTVVVVDKPDRTQSQIRIGHPSPAYATDAFRALTLAEAIFGGTFSSRLMQEVRVKRGWSYGANCDLGRSRGAHWLTLSLAPAAELTADAARLVHDLFAELVDGGITDDELEFARSHLLGSMPFYSATASQRMRLALRNHIYGLPGDFSDTLPARLAAVSRADVDAAVRAHFHPDAAVTVVVASAETAVPRLEAAGFAVDQRLAYDSY